MEARELAPEARRTLAGGGAKRNHRRICQTQTRPGRALEQPQLAIAASGVRRPCRDARPFSTSTGGCALLHHRL